ncbi:chitinase [Arthrobacter sp. C9C5]|uniref:chitinase n=1 Tax=Arthrobacter sp. C9C5 TaxID=2735267 RepID=UPI0015855B21|nr:chitinase [Arthrobacter sp. C9C5]NUU30111.1 glycosyl hydrolase [Arthrobacter sp. C9C5]
MQWRHRPRSRSRSGVLAASAVVLAVAACSPAPPTNYGQEPRTSQPALGPQWFGGYLDVTLSPSLRLQDTALHGAATTVLSFIGAHPKDTCQPSWDGVHTLDQTGAKLSVDSQITSFRKAGNDIAVSFGGQLGKELAETCTDLGALVKAYTAVITKYGLDTLDFDVEGAGLSDHAAAERRAAAAAKLQAERPAVNPLKVWLTLPVSMEGLTTDGEKSVTAMLDAGVELAGINIMVMDFEPLAPGQTMLAAAKSAAEATHQTLRALYEKAGKPLEDAALWQRIGLTPMIGMNDVKGQVFTLADAEGLNSFAVERGIGRMSMWSLNRDFACTSSSRPEEGSSASSNCSGVTQAPGMFAKLLGKSLTG